MKLILIVLAFAIASAAPRNDFESQRWQHQPVGALFSNFIVLYKKHYTASEAASRYDIFAKNLAFIQAHNAKNLSWTMALNQFSDLTQKEFQQMLLSKEVLTTPRRGAFKPSLRLPSGETPSSMDWRRHEGSNYVTAVRDEGYCGACYAIAAIGAIESACAIRMGRSAVRYSVQEILDCSGDYGSVGCNGGPMLSTFEYVKDHGICNASSYPYRSQKGENFKRSDGGCSKMQECAVTGWVELSEGDEEALLTAVAQGPVQVAIDASFIGPYSKGVYDSDRCSGPPNHTLLLIGYGTMASGKDYWIAQNVWGAGWGNKGYMKIARGKNMCGVALMASYPTVKTESNLVSAA